MGSLTGASVCAASEEPVRLPIDAGRRAEATARIATPGNCSRSRPSSPSRWSRWRSLRRHPQYAGAGGVGDPAQPVQRETRRDLRRDPGLSTLVGACAEAIIGPLLNTVPVRVTVSPTRCCCRGCGNCDRSGWRCATTRTHRSGAFTSGAKCRRAPRCSRGRGVRAPIAEFRAAELWRGMEGADGGAPAVLGHSAHAVRTCQAAARIGHRVRSAPVRPAEHRPLAGAS